MNNFIAVLGVFSMVTLKQELIPRVELPMVQVITVSPGATSEQMSERVAIPIERQVATIAEVESTETQSSSSFSMVTIEFEYGTDISRGANKVEQAISRAEADFPESAESQVITGGTADIPLTYISITSGDQPLETAQAVRTSVIPAIEKVDGVSRVDLIGAPEQRVTISIDQQRAVDLGVDAQAISDALEENGLAVPVGALTEGDTTMDVTVGQRIDSVEAVRDLPVIAETSEIELPDGNTAPGPTTTYALSEFAQVELTAGSSDVSGRIDGEFAVAAIVYPAANANVVETSHEVEDVLADLDSVVPEGTQFRVMFDQAPYIEGSISSLAKEGALGLVFAIFVILLFLRSIRSTLVTAISIPLSILAGFMGILVSGYTLNMLTLAALTLSIGRVVDDAIVVIENIKRHVDGGADKKTAVLAGTREVASAITASTLVASIVFLPIGLVSGMVGELFRPFALTIVIALLASLVVALTIVPVLAYWFLRARGDHIRVVSEDVEKPENTEIFVDRRVFEDAEAAEEARASRTWLRRTYEPALHGSQRHPWITVGVAAAILAGTVALMPFLKVNLLGSTNNGSIFLAQTIDSGTSIDAQVEIADQMNTAFESVEGVNISAATLGNVGFGEPNTINYFVSVDDQADITELTDAVIVAGEEVAGEDRVSAVSGGGLLGSNTADVDLTAPDFDTLAEAAEILRDELTELPEAKLVANNLEAATPAVAVVVDREAAAEVGLNENDIVGLIAAQMVQPQIGEVTIENIDTGIYLSIDNPVTSVEELREMQIMGQPLTEFADVNEVLSIPTIVTKDGQITATVSVTPLDDSNLGATSSAVEQKVAETELPRGTITTLGGAADQLQSSFNDLYMAIAAAVLLIYTVLVFIFKSLVQPMLLLLAIPFAGIGSFLALIITGTSMDLSAMIGLLMLTGIVVTNAVVLIDLINQHRARGDSLVDAVEHGAKQRVRPIVMTAFSTIVAMVPMAFGFSESSGFISQPLAVTVIGGLISSTAITLVLLPALYRLIMRRSEKQNGSRAS